MLEEGLARLHAAGEAPLAASLAADIQQALDSLALARVRDQFKSGSSNEPSERSRAVALLHDLLAGGGSRAGAAAARYSGPLMGLLGGAAAAAAAGDAAAAGMVGTAGVTPEVVREVVDHMTSAEVVAMADWDQVARRANSTHW